MNLLVESIDIPVRFSLMFVNMTLNNACMYSKLKTPACSKKKVHSGVFNSNFIYLYEKSQKKCFIYVSSLFFFSETVVYSRK